MKNKFKGFFVLVFLSLLLFTSSCKKSEGAGIFVFTSGEGSIFYDGIAVSYDLSFRCTISNQSDVPGTITAWKIVYKLGNAELDENIREINSGNCSTYNIAQLAGLRIDPNRETAMAGRTVPPIDRRMHYFSSIPNNMDISVTITDDHANQSTIHFNAVVSYSEDIGP